jgi:thiamine phosphate synthase YjbQ (UPF0047 family)
MQSHPIVSEPVKTYERSEIVDVTEIVRRLARQKNIRDGMAIIYVPHTTAAVTIKMLERERAVYSCRSASIGFIRAAMTAG